MRAWVDQIATIAGDDHVWSEGFQFGDWLDPAAPPRDPGAARTDSALVATAYHAHTARLLARVASVLGHDDRPRRATTSWRDQVTAGVQRRVRHRRPAGWRATRQTAYALALQLRPAAERATARSAPRPGSPSWCAATTTASAPASSARRSCATPSSTPGLVDDAYHLLLQTACPSWLYPVTMGATTVWERWDSLLPDGSINRTEMTSFNHYALGAIADFLHRVVAGLAPGGARLPAAARRPPARWWADPCRGRIADAVRRRQRAVEPARRSARRRRRRADRQHRPGRVARPTRRRGRPGRRTTSNVRTARPRSTRRGRRPRTRCSASSTTGPPTTAARRDSPAVTAS